MRPYADRKRNVISHHRTQVGPNGPMADMPTDMVERFLTTEQLRRAPLPWDGEHPPRGILDEVAFATPNAP